MSLRPLVLLSLVGLLAACSSEAPKNPVAAKAAVQQAAPAKVQEGLGPLPAHQRELSGQLVGAPAGALVELALLVIDDKGRPQRLLANTTLNGTNQPLPFQLRFNPESFPVGARVELRGRASQSGQLILHLPSLRIEQGTTQALGALQLVVAP
ncbi:YbaY family lipoprotein [Pseudomonas sp.]|uniref:YbaY family lipoprotein n=1 Tax=Pseudomonas sp. TaxID=306 RepID=UPI002632EFEC|nr:YbaY family lipoprotein [Pseudomonas sp.]